MLSNRAPLRCSSDLSNYYTFSVLLRQVGALCQDIWQVKTVVFVLPDWVFLPLQGRKDESMGNKRETGLQMMGPASEKQRFSKSENGRRANPKPLLHVDLEVEAQSSLGTW